MRHVALVVIFLTSICGAAAAAGGTPAAQALPTLPPAGSAASMPAPAGAAPPAPSAPASSAHDYEPSPPVESATTHPQAQDYRVWRLVDPTDESLQLEDAHPPRGWARLDTDAQSATFYAGGSFHLASGYAFAPFAHLTGSVVEPNIAITMQWGGLWAMPALGTSLDFGRTQAATIDPQLFLAADFRPLYLETWTQFFLAGLYHPSGMDTFAFRGMLLASITNVFSLGGEYDITVALRNGPPSNDLSSIVGGRINLRVGNRDTFGLFLGRQLASQARVSSEGIAGRFEYVHQW